MIKQMHNGGDLDYNHEEERIDPTQFFAELGELECTLLLKVLMKVNDLPYPRKSKPTKTTNKKSKTIVRREDTYTPPQMMAMEGTIIMGYNQIRSGQEGFDIVLEICGEYADEWAVCDASRKAVILVSQVSDHGFLSFCSYDTLTFQYSSIPAF